MARARVPSSAYAYLVLERTALRAALGYRSNFITLIAASAALQGTQLLFIGIVLSHFNLLAGWTLGDIALLYGMRLTSHAVCSVFFAQHFAVDWVIRRGEFDSYLLRPVSPLIQLLTRQFSVRTVGDTLLGVTVLIAGTQLAHVQWSVGLVAFTVVAVISGGLVEGGIQIAFSSLAFRNTTSYNAKLTLDTAFTDFGAYPLPIFGAGGIFALTFAIPLAFIAYLPCVLLLGKAHELLVPVWMAWAQPAVGPLLFAAGCAVFARQSRRYISPGA